MRLAVSSSEEADIGPTTPWAMVDLSQQVDLEAIEVMSLDLQKTTASHAAKLLRLASEVSSRTSHGSSVSAGMGGSADRTAASPLKGHEKLGESMSHVPAELESKATVGLLGLEDDASAKEEYDEVELDELAEKLNKSSYGKISQLPELGHLVMLTTLGELEGLEEGSADYVHEHTRGFKSLQKLTEKRKKHGAKMVIDFVARAEKELGVGDDTQVWDFVNLNKRLRPAFWKLAGIRKWQDWVIDLVQLMDDDEIKLVQAYAVRIGYALDRVGLEEGSWDTAQWSVPVQEASSSSRFGGEELELEAVTVHRESLGEMSKKQLRTKKRGPADDEELESSDKDKDKDEKEDSVERQKPCWKKMNADA
jgi:hypothetical protein